MGHSFRIYQNKPIILKGYYLVYRRKAFSNDTLRKNIFGLTGGIDLNFNHLVAGLRAGWDVKNNGDGTSDTPRYKNMLYQATLGYRF